MNPREKATEIVARAPKTGAVLTFGQDTVRFVEDAIVNEAGAVVLNLDIKRNGSPLNISMPLIIGNPPVVVEDPSGTIQVEDDEGNITYATVDGRRALDEILRTFLERR